MYKFLIFNSLIILITIAILWDIKKTPNIVIASTNHNIINYQKPQKLDNFNFKDIYGNHFSIADFSDKTILLNFWATWCLPCLSELPDLIKLSQNNDIILIAISIDKNKEQITNFLEKLNIEPKSNIKWVLDKNIPSLFNIQKIPETIIIKNMLITNKVIGVIDWQEYFLSNNK